MDEFGKCRSILSTYSTPFIYLLIKRMYSLILVVYTKSLDRDDLGANIPNSLAPGDIIESPLPSSTWNRQDVLKRKTQGIFSRRTLRP
jgi:hypothetical protein